MLTHGTTKSHAAAMADESTADSVDGESKSSSSCITGMSGTEKKKRRGVIEKRRRDRINCSLYDLKRLVPEITYKTGSSKLEKAEILQATVDFLQRLYKDGHVFASEARAIEQRRLGFRECLLEVNRLLSSYQDSSVSAVQFNELHRGLLTSLHHYDQQQEVESKAYLTSVAAVTNVMADQHQQEHQQHHNHYHHHQQQPHSIPQACQAQTEPNRQTCDLTAGALGKHQIGQVAPIPYGSQNYRYAWTSSMQGTVNTVPPPQISQSVVRQQHEEHVYVPNDISYLPNSRPMINTSQLSDGGTTGVNCKMLFPKSEGESETGNSSLGVGNSLTTYRPNESQSTSSPPLRSTPEDTDPGSSPQLPGGFPRLPNNSSSTEKSLNYIGKPSPPDGAEQASLLLSASLCSRDDQSSTGTYLAHQQQSAGRPLTGPSCVRPVAAFSRGAEVKQSDSSYSASVYPNSFQTQPVAMQPCLDQYAQINSDADRLAFTRHTNGTWEYGAHGLRCEASSPLPPADNYLTSHSYWQY